jgi:hypothetical protein
MLALGHKSQCTAARRAFRKKEERALMTTSLYIAQHLKRTQRYASACHEFTMSVNLFGHRDRYGLAGPALGDPKSVAGGTVAPARAVFSGNSLLIGTLRAVDP